jgi:hypothetical protein
MDKQQLLEWINQLPDDLEADPIDFCSMKEESTDWQPQIFQKIAPYNRYQKYVHTDMNLKIRFKENFVGEFTRDRFGVDVWSNIHRIK